VGAIFTIKDNMFYMRNF